MSYPRGILSAEAEVVVIGGGITGITSAYLLAKEGRHVALLEKGKVGEGVTAYTTAFLTQVIDVDPATLIKSFGIEKARLILSSHFEAIDAVEKIIQSEKIECEFKRCTNYVYANAHKEEKNLLKMVEAFHLLGVAAEYKKDATLRFPNVGYIEIPNQAKFNAAKYVTALTKLAQDAGAVIAEGTEVLELDEESDFVEVKIKNARSIKAKKVLSATYIPFGNSPRLSHRGNMYRSYVLEYKIPVGIFVEGMYQDELMPYHYFRIDTKDGNDRMLLGGADDLEVASANPELNFQTLRAYVEKLLENHPHEEITHWSGRILNPIGGLPYIGTEKNSNIFYIFGFSGNGMTYSYIASKIFVDQLLSRTNPYAELYALNRKTSWWASIF